ncbi:MAG TPA: hypothetical protein VL285_20270, partial [Bryobacteraceae bacterium]|nr:hypothetical protein [Bryobacteraceae bacterium]
EPEFIEGLLPDLVIGPRAAKPAAAQAPANGAASDAETGFWSEPAAEAPAAEPAASQSQAYWMLSLFAPTAEDPIEWERGAYSVISRGGRVESAARSGDLKKLQNMVAEGSVLVSASDPRGAAADVAPDGFPHPVYRAGFALAIPIPQGAQ